MTLRLWRALRHPPYHSPIFRRIRGMSAAPSRVRQVILLTLGYFMSCLLFSYVWPYLFTAPSVILALIIGLGNSLYGMIWAGGVSAAIARERELKTYDLLCLQPPGTLGVDWALSTGTLHRSSFFRDLPAVIQVLAAAFIGALLIVALFILITLADENTEEGAQLLLASAQGIALAAAFYFDHVQSLVLANLVGMITPIYIPDRLNARLWATGSFLLFKIAIYMVVVLIDFFMLPPLFSSLNMDGHSGVLILTIGQFVIFYSVSDVLVTFLWRRFVQPRTPRPEFVF